MAHRGLIVALVWLGAAAGCSGGERPRVPAATTGSPSGTSTSATAKPPSGPPSPFPTAPGEPLLRRIAVKRFDMAIGLPDPAGWRVVREKSRFAILEHPATASRLVLRLWLEDEAMDREACERRARLWRDFPRVVEPLSSDDVAIPRDFDTHVDAGVSGTGGTADGYLVAFGGGGKRCFAFAYTTSATAPDAERVVTDRLAFVQERVLGSVTLIGSTTALGTPLPR